MSRNRLNVVFTGLVLLAMLIAAPAQVFARGEEDGKDGGMRIGYSNETGRVSFIGADPSDAYLLEGVAVESFAPRERPMLYLENFKELLGLQQPSRELVKTADRQHDGRSTTRYQQMYEGIPILGGELIVNLDRRGALLSISGEVSPDLSLATTPEITANEARATALAAIAKYHDLEVSKLSASEPELWIFDERLLRPSTKPAELVWRMEVTAKQSAYPIRELVLIDAVRGGISLHFNQVDAFWAEFEEDPPETADPSPTPTAAPTEVEPTLEPTPTEVEPTLEPTPTEAEPTIEPTPTEVEPTPEPTPTEVEPTLEPTPTAVEPTLEPTPTVEITPTAVEPTPTVESPIPDESGDSPREPFQGWGDGETFYVKPDGDDDLDCRSPETACATISAAVDKAANEDTIYIAVGTYTGTGESAIDLTKDLLLSGGWEVDFSEQTGHSVIDGEGVRRGVRIDHQVTSEFVNLQFTNGYANDEIPIGGGIQNLGYLTMRDCIVNDNRADWHGGGIYTQDGALDIFSTEIRGNQAESGGGVFSFGLYNIEGSWIVDNTATDLGGGLTHIQMTSGPDTLTSYVYNTVITGNQADSGAGIYFEADGPVELDMRNTTVSDNQAVTSGGGFYAAGDDVNLGYRIFLNNVTITHNHAPAGGGVYVVMNSFVFQNSILAGNYSSVEWGDCNTPDDYLLVSNGHNLTDGFYYYCNYFRGETDWPTHYPNLVPAVDMDGIYIPAENSPAVDWGSPGVPGSDPLACEPTDQFGTIRPQGDACDVGAVEGSVPNLKWTYTAENQWFASTGWLLCTDDPASCTDGVDPHADAAHLHAQQTYDFYLAHHGRDSYNDRGSPIYSIVHFGEGWSNATALDVILYGDAYGFPLADDVTAHEYTHWVTLNTSRLFYYYQSGAINESFSDLWGEFVDLTNGTGNDDPSVRWLLGEDIGDLGAIRDMADPPSFADPDRMTDVHYYTEIADGIKGDAGGVHRNSGVNNKAAYLMTDGDTFNGQTITGLGIDKVAAIYYEVQTNLLTSAADYGDLYHALYQGCLNLVGGAEGITAGDCIEVQQATIAVEMDQEPVPGYNPDAAVCDGAGNPVDIFFDDMEGELVNWETGVVRGDVSWFFVHEYATSGWRSLYGDDSYPSNDGFVAMSLDVPLASGSTPYLHFRHAFGFEEPNWDGGILEYSTDGGTSWYDAEVLFDDGLGYTGKINSISDNPNTGRHAFVSDSHGYVSSRYDLSSLTSQSVRFRWRLSTDSSISDLGWVIDDVRIYTCALGEAPPNTPDNPDPADDATDVSIETDLNWVGGDPDGDPVTYDVYFDAEDSNPETLVCDDVSTPSCDPGMLDFDTTYYWYVEANDGEDTSTGQVWDFTTRADAPVELLVNNSLELVVPSGWKGDRLDSADGSDCAQAYSGSCSMALTGPSGGETKMLFYGLPGFSGSAGDTFNLSYYNRRQDVGGAGAVQVRVSIRYTDATMGHFSFVPGVGTADWELLSHDFTAEKDYDWGVVRLIFSKPDGTLWYDEMSLLRNGSEEMLDNGDMEIRVPSMWKGDKLTLADGSDCVESHSGTCSVALTGSEGGETKMLFYGLPDFSGSAGDTFTLSYFNRRQDVGGAGAVQVRVSIRYTDATMGHFSFVPGVGTADWEMLSHEFTAEKDYDWGVIRLIFSKPNGTLWYDEISLTR